MKAKTALTLISVIILVPIMYNNCGGFSGANPSPSTTDVPTNAIAVPYSPPLSITGAESNVVPVNVGCGYVNEPCVTVTLCRPGGTAGSSQCVSIPNILLDTGSYGLRVFSSLMPFGLTPETDPSSGGQVAECISYADGSSDWGPVVTADVLLGNGLERAAGIPVQLINANFGRIPSDCTQPDTDPSSAGFNGILGVGLFSADCGDNCASDANNRIYFSCAGASCNPMAVANSMQVSNPVMSLPADNNGVILQLPGVAPQGVGSVNGYLILGIGTQTDNSPPAGVSVFGADGNGNFQTYFNGQMYPGSFIDSGSDALYFSDSAINPCSSPNASGFYCPGSLIGLSGVQFNAGDTLQDLISFPVTDAEAAFSANYGAVPGLAGDGSGYFDWGLPFFFGKTVYVGAEGRGSPLGSGPYWAF